MDPAGDPSLKISGMRTVSLREKWKNYSRKSTTSTTMQKVLESTHLNKQSIFKDTLKKQLSNLQSFQNQFCGHDMTTRSFGVGFSNANHSLKNTRVGFFGEIGVFLANKLSWTLWNHHLLIYIYIHIYTSIILARFVPTIPGKQRLGFLWTIEFLVWNLSWNLRSTRRNKNPTRRWSNTPNGKKQRVH